MSLGSTHKDVEDNPTDPLNTGTIDEGIDSSHSSINELPEQFHVPSFATIPEQICAESPDIPCLTKHNNVDTCTTRVSEINKHIPSKDKALSCDEPTENISALSPLSTADTLPPSAITVDTPSTTTVDSPSAITVDTPSITTVDSPPTTTADPSITKTVVEPLKRTFRQRRAEQLRPYTMDRLKHQSLLGGKRSSTLLGTTVRRGKTSSVFAATQDFILGSQSYMDDNVCSDSDDDYDVLANAEALDDFDNLDFGYMDELDDNASQLSENTHISDKTIRTVGHDDNDDDSESDEQQSRKKRRRFRILDDDDDGTDPTTVLDLKTNDQNTSVRDIFALPSFDPLPTLITKPSSHNQLITYKRPKGKKRDKGKQRTEHHEFTNAKNTHTQSNVPLSSAHLMDKDIFDIQSLGELDRRHNLGKSNDDDLGYGTNNAARLDSGGSIHAMTAEVTLLPTSQSVPSTSKSVLSIPKTAPSTSIRQKPHNLRHINDDDGFIVDENDGYEERRRNTTLNEVRKNRRTLKGVLPNSFVKVFQQQLDLEVHTVRRQSTTLNRSSRKTDNAPKETGEHNTYSPARLMDTSVDIWAPMEADDDNTDSPTRSMDTSVDIWDATDKYDDSSPATASTLTQNDSFRPTIPRAFNLQHQQQRQLHEREEQRQEKYRQCIIESLATDCGVPSLRSGSIYTGSLNYLDDKAFAVFSLEHQHSSWDNVYDQPFSDVDYYTNSPKIIALFYQAFQHFYIMWMNPEYADCDTNGYNTHNISAFVGFLRFVSGCLSKCYQNEDTSGHNTAEMEQFIADEMDIFVLRVLDTVGWTDGTKMEWRGDSSTRYSSLPLLLVLFYTVEWAFQLGRLTSENSHWTVEVTIRRLFWYLLSLGPTSVQVTSIEPYTFKVSNPFAVEAWILALRMIKLEASVDTILWPCLLDFRQTLVAPDASDISGNRNVVSTLKKNEVTWQWIMTLLLLQQIQKNDDRIVVVNTLVNKDVNTQPYNLIHHLLTNIDYKNLFTETPDDIINSIAQAAGTQQTDHFYTMVGIRTTLCRYHLLMTRHGWNWDMKTMNILTKWLETQAIQVITGDPRRPVILMLQDHLEAPAKYFPPSILYYNGSFDDDHIDRLDTGGMVFMKILSLGLRQMVKPILDRNSDAHRKLLRQSLIHMIPACWVVDGRFAKDIVAGYTGAKPTPTFLSPTALINKPLHSPDPFISMAYYYMTNIIILHVTAPLGNENNPGLEVLKCNIVMQSASDTVEAWVKDMWRLGHRIYETVKEKWKIN